MASEDDRRSLSPDESEPLTTSSSISGGVAASADVHPLPPYSPSLEGDALVSPPKCSVPAIIIPAGESGSDTKRSPLEIQDAPDSTAGGEEVTGKIQMKQTLGLWNGVGIIVGIIIGEL